MITVDHTANLGDRILVLDYTRGHRKCGFLGAEDASLAVCTPVKDPIPRLGILDTNGNLRMRKICGLRENAFGKQFLCLELRLAVKKRLNRITWFCVSLNVISLIRARSICLSFI